MYPHGSSPHMLSAGFVPTGGPILAANISTQSRSSGRGNGGNGGNGSMRGMAGAAVTIRNEPRFNHLGAPTSTTSAATTTAAFATNPGNPMSMAAMTPSTKYSQFHIHESNGGSSNHTGPIYIPSTAPQMAGLSRVSSVENSLDMRPTLSGCSIKTHPIQFNPTGTAGLSPTTATSTFGTAHPHVLNLHRQMHISSSGSSVSTTLSSPSLPMQHTFSATAGAAPPPSVPTTGLSPHGPHTTATNANYIFMINQNPAHQYQSQPHESYPGPIQVQDRVFFQPHGTATMTATPAMTTGHTTLVSPHKQQPVEIRHAAAFHPTTATATHAPAVSVHSHSIPSVPVQSGSVQVPLSVLPFMAHPPSVTGQRGLSGRSLSYSPGRTLNPINESGYHHPSGAIRARTISLPNDRMYVYGQQQRPQQPPRPPLQAPPASLSSSSNQMGHIQIPFSIPVSVPPLSSATAVSLVGHHPQMPLTMTGPTTIEIPPRMDGNQDGVSGSPNTEGSKPVMEEAQEDRQNPGFRRVPILGQPPKTNHVNVSAQMDRSSRGLRPYLVRARRLMRLRGASWICGIGQAVSVAVDVVEQLKRERTAVVVSIQTDLIDSPPYELKVRPAIDVELACGEWGHLVSDFRRRKIIEIFELNDKELKGEVSVEYWRKKNLAKVFHSSDDLIAKADLFLKDYETLNLPQFIEYCSILVHPLLLEFHFKTAIKELGGSVDIHDGPLPAVHSKGQPSILVPLHLGRKSSQNKNSRTAYYRKKPVRSSENRGGRGGGGPTRLSSSSSPSSLISASFVAGQLNNHRVNTTVKPQLNANIVTQDLDLVWNGNEEDDEDDENVDEKRDHVKNGDSINRHKDDVNHDDDDGILSRKEMIHMVNETHEDDEKVAVRASQEKKKVSSQIKEDDSGFVDVHSSHEDESDTEDPSHHPHHHLHSHSPAMNDSLDTVSYHLPQSSPLAPSTITVQRAPSSEASCTKKNFLSL